MKRTKQFTRLHSRFLYTHEGSIGDESDIRQAEVGAASEINGRSISLDQCSLNRTRIVQAPGIRLTDCVLETVDAANAVLDESGWKDILVRESRWTGARANFAHMVDVVFQECQMSHSQLQESTLKDVRFEGCDLQGAYFNGAQMRGSVFQGSNLTGVDFTRADITECDFRRAIIEDIRVAPEQLSGVIVTQDQALYLTRLFGLEIRE